MAAKGQQSHFDNFGFNPYWVCQNRVSLNTKYRTNFINLGPKCDVLFPFNLIYLIMTNISGSYKV